MACELWIAGGVCEENVSREWRFLYLNMPAVCIAYIYMCICTIRRFLRSHTVSVLSSTKCVHFLSHSWEQLAVLRNSAPYQTPAARLEALLFSTPIETVMERYGREGGVGVTAAFQRLLIIFIYCCFLRRRPLTAKNLTSTVVLVTESRSQKYLLANLSFLES